MTHRVSSYRDAEMALRWTATGFLAAEKSFRKIQGHQQIWVLATALGRSIEEVDVKDARCLACEPTAVQSFNYGRDTS